MIGAPVKFTSIRSSPDDSAQILALKAAKPYRRSWCDCSDWRERLDIFGKFKRFCQACTRSFFFWFAVAFFAVLEPFLCAQHFDIGLKYAQVIVLGISSLLYVIQLIGVATAEWEKILLIEAMANFRTISISNTMKDFTVLKLLVFFTAEGEYILEGSMIALGWGLIFWRPGLATLRCFRVFRLLWFYEVEVFKSTSLRILAPIIGEEYVLRGFKVFKFAIKSLSALGNEMFRLTNETRGGLLLMMMIFYCAFVLGASLYVETEGKFENCVSVGSCTFTLLRLTFFDGNGFDFAFFLTHDHRILFFIVMVYLCMTSFGIVNGLVGIFGTAFARASEIAFDDDEDDEGVPALDEALLNGTGMIGQDDEDDEDGSEEDEDGFSEDGGDGGDEGGGGGAGAGGSGGEEGEKVSKKVHRKFGSRSGFGVGGMMSSMIMTGMKRKNTAGKNSSNGGGEVEMTAKEGVDEEADDDEDGDGEEDDVVTYYNDQDTVATGTGTNNGPTGSPITRHNRSFAKYVAVPSNRDLNNNSSTNSLPQPQPLQSQPSMVSQMTPEMQNALRSIMTSKTSRFTLKHVASQLKAQQQQQQQQPVGGGGIELRPMTPGSISSLGSAIPSTPYALPPPSTPSSLVGGGVGSSSRRPTLQDIVRHVAQNRRASDAPIHPEPTIAMPPTNTPTAAVHGTPQQQHQSHQSHQQQSHGMSHGIGPSTNELFAASLHQQRDHHGAQQTPAHLHSRPRRGAGGMFAMSRQKSIVQNGGGTGNPGLAATGGGGMNGLASLTAAANAATNAANQAQQSSLHAMNAVASSTAEMRMLSNRVSELSNVVTVQTEMMTAMYTHIAFLSKQLSVLNPSLNDTIQEKDGQTMPEVVDFQKRLQPMNRASGIGSNPAHNTSTVSRTTNNNKPSFSDFFGGGGGNNSGSDAPNSATKASSKMAGLLGKVRANKNKDKEKEKATEKGNDSPAMVEVVTASPVPSNKEDEKESSQHHSIHRGLAPPDAIPAVAAPPTKTNKVSASSLLIAAARKEKAIEKEKLAEDGTVMLNIQLPVSRTPSAVETCDVTLPKQEEETSKEVNDNQKQEISKVINNGPSNASNSSNNNVNANVTGVSPSTLRAIHSIANVQEFRPLNSVASMVPTNATVNTIGAVSEKTTSDPLELHKPFNGTDLNVQDINSTENSR